MANLLYPPSRPQSVGEVLDSGFRIYGTTLIKCLPYSFAAVVVGQLQSAYNLVHGYPLARGTPAQVQHEIRDPFWWLLLLLLGVGTTMLTNAVVLRQFALATGRAANARAELVRALRRLPGMLLIGILVSLIAVAIAIPCMLLAGMLGAALGGRAPTFTVLIVVFSLVGFSWVFVRFICAGTTYLLTERTAVESMRHSWQLTAGNFWRLSAIYAVGITLVLVFYVLTSVVGAMVALLVVHGDVTVVFAVTATLVALLAALFTPFIEAVFLAIFGDLSVRREGSDLVQRLSVPAPQ
jgi:ABC-type multidrug transport system fused ATPase/permease subunit